MDVYISEKDLESVGNVGGKITICCYGTTETGLEYVNIPWNDGITITGYVGSASEIIFAETINGYPVTDIADYAFADCSGLTSVIFLGDAPFIGANAFQNVTATISYMSHNVTWTADKLQNYGGNLTWNAVIPPAFSNASIVLKEDLSIKFGVSGELFESGVYTEPFAIFQIGYTTQKVTDYTIMDGKYYFVCSHISPSQIGDTVTATVYAMRNGEEVQLDSMEYGVAVYCYNMLAKTDDEALRTLLVDLLNYGSAAQKYAGYKTGSLSNSQLTAEQQSWASAEELELGSVLSTKYQTVKDAKATWKAAGLVLENSVTMRFRFAAESTEGLSVKIVAAGQEWNVTEFEPIPGKDGQYYVYFSGLSARQMRESVFVTVYEGGTRVSNTLRYSVETYAYNKRNDANTKLSDLVKAMMRYGISAKNYLN